MVFKERRYLCAFLTTAACRRGFRSKGGLTQHRDAKHGADQPIAPCDQQPFVEEVRDDGEGVPIRKQYHRLLDGTPL